MAHYLQQETGAFRLISSSDISTASGIPLQNYTTYLSSDITSTSTAVFTTVVQTTQGSSGTWLCIGRAVFTDSAKTYYQVMEITDGATVFGSGLAGILATATSYSGSVFAVATSPTTNLKLLVRPNAPSATGLIQANASGGAKDTGLTVVRIG